MNDIIERLRMMSERFRPSGASAKDVTVRDAHAATLMDKAAAEILATRQQYDLLSADYSELQRKLEDARYTLEVERQQRKAAKS
jgi:hypothetical protein